MFAVVRRLSFVDVCDVSCLFVVCRFVCCSLFAVAVCCVCVVLACPGLLVVVVRCSLFLVRCLMYVR